MLLRFSHNFLSFPFLSRRKKPILVLCDPRGAVLSCFSNEKLLLFPPSETGSRKRVRTRLVFHDEKRANPSPPPLTIFFVEGNGCIDVSRAINSFFFLSFLAFLPPDGQVFVTERYVIRSLDALFVSFSLYMRIHQETPSLKQGIRVVFLAKRRIYDDRNIVEWKGCWIRGKLCANFIPFLWLFCVSWGLKYKCG